MWYPVLQLYNIRCFKFPMICYSRKQSSRKGRNITENLSRLTSHCNRCEERGKKSWMIFLFSFTSYWYREKKNTKWSKSIDKSVWLKMKLIQKVTNIASQLPTYYNKGTNNLGQVTNISYNARFALFLKYIFLYELLKFSNSQTRVFGWKWSQLKKLTILLMSYQYIVINVPTIWASCQHIRQY